MNHPPSPIYPNNTAFQRFLPTGPLAFLPLSEEASTMVWSTRPELAAALKKISPEALTAMVNAGYSVPESTLEVLHSQLLSTPSEMFTVEKINSIIQSQPALPTSIDQTLPTSITSISPRSIASFPLRLSHADTYTGSRTVLVGDAAHTIHPLAGQGLNMGLADVRSLANTLETAKRTGMDLGSELAVRDYPKERYFENHLMLSATDHLNQIFGSRNGLVNWVRGTGLDVINEVGWIKKVFMAGAGAGVKVTGTGGKRTEAGDAGLGWQGFLANAVEGAGQLRGVVGGVAAMAGDVLRSSFKGPGGR
jgi:ubiquinone biosynthesis monooxygenase Coq6